MYMYMTCEIVTWYGWMNGMMHMSGPKG